MTILALTYLLLNPTILAQSSLTDPQQILPSLRRIAYRSNYPNAYLLVIAHYLLHTESGCTTSTGTSVRNRQTRYLAKYRVPVKTHITRILICIMYITISYIVEYQYFRYVNDSQTSRQTIASKSSRHLFRISIRNKYL